MGVRDLIAKAVAANMLRGAVAAPIGAGALGEMYDQGKYEAAP